MNFRSPTRRISRKGLWQLSLLVLSLVNSALCADDLTPKHLAVALTLVKHLEINNTSYQHGKPDILFSVPYRCHADCSGFLDELLRHSYGYSSEQFQDWFGRERPTAGNYYDAIAKQVIFEPVTGFRNVRPGDILAVKYEHPKEKSTGHVMLIAGSARSIIATAPLIPETDQWQIPVIDSARSGHGNGDTRHARGIDGKDHDGLGEGILRVYTDRKGDAIGYTWSLHGKHLLRHPTEKMLIGRLRR